MSKVRVDKWLWSIRLFKTRTKASKACKAGDVRNSLGTILKPSSDIEVGDFIVVKKNGINFTIKTIELITKRVSFPLAQKCYEDHTPKEELEKFENWYISGKGTEYRERGAGRPTKKERRDLDDFKGTIPNPLHFEE